MFAKQRSGGADELLLCHDTVDTPFQQTVERTVAKLKDQGFGVLTKMDVQATLKEKIAAPIFDPHQAV
jgi:uncharacterized protein (DUF302 family)